MMGSISTKTRRGSALRLHCTTDNAQLRALDQASLNVDLGSERLMNRTLAGDFHEFGALLIGQRAS